MNTTLKEAHEKYLHGESMTDKELKVVYNYYQTLHEALNQVHQPKYALMLHDVYSHIQTIELINQFRSNDK